MDRGDLHLLLVDDESDILGAMRTFLAGAIPGTTVHTATSGAEARLRTGWAGLCVATPDRRPLCGPVPGRPGLYVVTGDNGFGLMRSLALGQRLADAVQGRGDPALDPARFGPAPSDAFPMAEGYGATAAPEPQQHR